MSELSAPTQNLRVLADAPELAALLERCWGVAGTPPSLESALGDAARLLGFDGAVVGAIESDRYVVEATYLSDGGGLESLRADLYADRQSPRIVEEYGLVADTTPHAFVGLPIHQGGALHGTLEFASRTPAAAPLSAASCAFVRMFAAWVEATLDQREVAILRAECDRLQGRITEVSRDLAQFTYFISHDLQAPVRQLASFVGFLEADLGGALDESIEKDLGFIKNSGDRLSTLIRSVLELSRAGRAETCVTRIDPRDAVEIALEDARAHVGDADAEISIGDMPAVLADAATLARVFEHLIRNALTYRAPDQTPQIDVSATQVGDKVEITVSDDGIGFDPAERERILLAFERLHGAEEFPGTGVGLAICRTLLDLQGGRVRADGRPGEGAKFTVELPSAD